MSGYRYNNGKNSDYCIINGRDLVKEGFDVNIVSEMEDDKGVTITKTAGTKVIYEFSNFREPLEFTLSFKFGQELYDFTGRTSPQEGKFKAQLQLFEELYNKNEPLEITFPILNLKGIFKIVMLNRRITHRKLFEMVEVDCIEYQEQYVQIQSEQSAENWYVNTLDNSDIQSNIDDYLGVLGG